MGSEIPHLKTALPRNMRVCAVIATAMAHEPFSSRFKQTSRGPRRLVGNILVVAVVMLTLLAVPARGRRVFSAFSSPELLLLSFERLPRRSKEAVTTLVRRSTSTAAPPPEFVRIACAASGSTRYGGLGSMARGSKIRSPWSLGRAAGVVCGSIGDGNNGGDEGSLFDSDDEQQEDNTRDGDDTPMFSFAAVEDELQSRSAAKTTTRGGGAGDGADGESGWWPRFFPPREDGDVVQPLVELPLDGVLLQLFPALLIGVVGLFLTIAVQVEASRFDGMVGDDGGAVVVTDLRDTTTTAEPQP